MRISFLGDIMVKKEQLDSYRVNGKYDFVPALESIGKEFSLSDLIIANLETPIAGEKMGYTSEPYSFNTPLELVETLKEMGVSIITTANNHCMDRGEKGLTQTIHNLRSCGLEHLGTHIKREDSYLIKEIGGIRVGFLSFTYGTNAFSNGNYLTEKHRYMVDMLQRQELSNPLVRKMWLSSFYPFRCMRALLRRLHIGQFDKPVYERRERQKEELRYYRDTILKCKNIGKADYVIAYLHIGGQYNLKPTDYTKEICKLSKDMGVNAVIANHEHVIHCIEPGGGISGTSFCIYSLGNFLSSSGVLSGPYDKRAEYSVAVNIDLTKNDAGKVEGEYSFELFINCLDAHNRVISRPLIDHISQCTDGSLKDRLLDDYNILMNKILNTQQISYPLLREYKIEDKDW